MKSREELRREVLEPADKQREHCHQERPKIGQETTTEYDYQPAKLFIHETVRPKYGQCRCGCGQAGVVIAPLPPRLVPQSKLGRDAPQKRLSAFKGTIQTDAYEVYKSLRRERPRELKRLGCLGHARRLFYKAVLESSSEAIGFIAQIRQLYRIEDEVREAGPEERKAVRGINEVIDH